MGRTFVSIRRMQKQAFTSLTMASNLLSLWHSPCRRTCILTIRFDSLQQFHRQSHLPRLPEGIFCISISTARIVRGKFVIGYDTTTSSWEIHSPMTPVFGSRGANEL